MATAQRTAVGASGPRDIVGPALAELLSRGATHSQHRGQRSNLPAGWPDFPKPSSRGGQLPGARRPPPPPPAPTSHSAAPRGPSLCLPVPAALWALRAEDTRGRSFVRAAGFPRGRPHPPRDARGVRVPLCPAARSPARQLGRPLGGRIVRRICPRREGPPGAGSPSSRGRGTAPAGLAGHFHEKGAAEAPLLAFTACLNCIDIKSRSAVNTQRGPQGCGGRRAAGPGSGQRLPLAWDPRPKGANAPASSPRGARGGGAAPRRRFLLGLQPGSAPNSEEPTLLPLPQRGGGPSKPLGRNLAHRGIAARRRWRRGVSERVRARPPAAGRREARSPLRQRSASFSAAASPAVPPSPARPASALRKRLKKRISMLRNESQSLFTAQRAHPAHAPGTARAVGGEKAGETRRSRSRDPPRPGPEHSYPSRAGAAAVASASSSGPARRCPGRRRARGRRQRSRVSPRAPRAGWEPTVRGLSARRAPSSCSPAPARERLSPARRRRRRRRLRAYPRPARAPGDYHWGAR